MIKTQMKKTEKFMIYVVLKLLIISIYSQSKQIFGNCDVSRCDVFDKGKAHLPPNNSFISFVYLTLDDLAVRSKVQQVLQYESHASCSNSTRASISHTRVCRNHTLEYHNHTHTCQNHTHDC
jgi:hypothetical protein